MICTNPRRIFKNLDLDKYPQGIEVPCGQCMNCRVKKRDEWSLRIMHESLYWDSCIFLTLTYDDEHLPKNGSLLPNDLTKFFKRLRKSIGNRKIKYFACGDYGKKERPHYHIIMFGMDFLNPDDIDIIKSCWNLCDWNMLGRLPFGNVTPQSIRYVCRYIESKVLGKESYYAYDLHNILPTYAVMSKGIGKNYAIDNNSKIIKELKCTALGKTYGIPRYYRKITDIPIEDIKEYGKVREIKIVEKITGNVLTREQAYNELNKDEIIKIEDAIKESNKQIELNTQSIIDIKNRK